MRDCICVLTLQYRYIGEDFTLGALKTHRYIEDRYIGVLSHTFY